MASDRRSDSRLNRALCCTASCPSFGICWSFCLESLQRTSVWHGSSWPLSVADMACASPASASVHMTECELHSASRTNRNAAANNARAYLFRLMYGVTLTALIVSFLRGLPKRGFVLFWTRSNNSRRPGRAGDAQTIPAMRAREMAMSITETSSVTVFISIFLSMRLPRNAPRKAESVARMSRR